MLSPRKTVQNSYFLLISAISLVNILFAAPRLMPGLPMGVDSSSHLYKVMFMVKSFAEQGYVPDWTPEWYGGMHLFRQYPPLSYYLVFLLALTGLGPVWAYKLIDFTFYLIAPFTLYHLARELDIDTYSSLIASLIFSLSPLIIENYLFYDRFPNIIALPLLCCLLICANRLFKGGSEYYLLPSSLLLAALILVHHLSALYAILILLILAVTNVASSRGWRRSLILSFFMIIGAVGVSSFWIIPFLENIRQMTINPFFNRNVIDDAYMKLTYFARDMVIYFFGIAHFILTLTALSLISFRFKGARGRNLVLFFALLLVTSLTLFETGIVSQVRPLVTTSQTTLLIGFVILASTILMISGKMLKEHWTGYLFCIAWFSLFFWLSLGGYAVPFSNERALPYLNLPWIQIIWMSLDIQRFWLFLALPMSILASYPLAKLMKMVTEKRRSKSTLAAVLILVIMGLGGFVKAYYSLTQPISEYVPTYMDASNSDIPQDLITYFRSKPIYGRILNIKCPFWIYLLPYYTDKPLVDGWYPQGKLLNPLIRINDYRINDLEASNGSLRIQTWRGLVSNSSLLGIDWVVFGDDNQTLQDVILSGSDYTKVKVIPYEEGSLVIYESLTANRFFSLTPSQDARVDLARKAPDRIEITLSQPVSDADLTIKEAYTPSWRAEGDAGEIPVRQDKYGLILIHVPPNITKIRLCQPRQTSLYYLVSALTILVLIGMVFAARRITSGGQE